jgi:hypothetical protein
MRHYTTIPTRQGWAVAYANHRGEFVSVMECPTLETAYDEAARMTAEGFKSLVTAATFFQPSRSN